MFDGIMASSMSRRVETMTSKFCEFSSLFLTKYLFDITVKILFFGETSIVDNTLIESKQSSLMYSRLDGKTSFSIGAS